EKGLDYPAAYVRWTENRNFGAVLSALASGALDVAPLITRRVPLDRFPEIYDDMSGGSLGSLLVYDTGVPRATETSLIVGASSFGKSDGVLAVIGAGNFTKMTALPALSAAAAKIKVIVSAGGV